MTDTISTSRRAFLKRSATASGFTLGLTLLPASRPSAMFANTPASDSLTPSVFVSIHENGEVEIICHRSEMGQQIRTSIPQIIVEELGADWQFVKVVQATGHPKFGDQNTDGSRSIRRNFDRLREAGATAAYLLRAAAATGWQVDIADCEVSDHQVVHKPTGKKVGFGKLVAVAATLPLPEADKLALKPRKDWQSIGKPIRSLDIQAMTSGKAVYGQDVILPDMCFAVIQRPPVVFSSAESVNDADIKAMPGVLDVITLPAPEAPAMFKPLGGVAIVAKNTWQAWQASKSLSVKWSEHANAVYNSTTYREQLLATANNPGEVVRHQGNFSQAEKQAHSVLKAQYYAPHLAQAPMEPPAATAVVTDDSAQVWTSVQTPQAARQVVAAALNLDPEKVTINVTLLGGGFGRKSKPDFVVEAALLAKAMKRPVKVVWRREDDLQHGYFHTVSAQALTATFNQQNQVTGWLHNSVFPSISSTFDPSANKPSDGELDLGLVDTPFDIENLQLERGEAIAHVRIGWMRSVANVYHAFAIQSFVDEIAHHTGKDQQALLLELIGPDRHIDFDQSNAKYGNYGDPLDAYPVDTARLKNVINTVCEKANWAQRHKQGRYLGLAAHRSFLTYAAVIIEVEVNKSGSWSIPKAYVALDAGTVVNPEHVKAQCEGGIIYGISCAIGQITASNGQINESNFHNYLVARMPQTPVEVDVTIVDSVAPPGGVGEPPTPPAAPALANALFAATGVRLRELPIPLSVKGS